MNYQFTGICTCVRSVGLGRDAKRDDENKGEKIDNEMGTLKLKLILFFNKLDDVLYL